MTANQIAYQKLLEEGRSNRVREAETERSNRAGESQKLQELEETKRRNLATEAESARHNTASEQLSYNQLLANQSLGYANLAESQRSHLAQELENARHNVASEEATRYTADQRLAGAVTQAQTNQSINTQKLAVEKALTQFKEQEANKRHKASLAVEREKTTSGLLNKLTDSIVKLLPLGG